MSVLTDLQDAYASLAAELKAGPLQPDYAIDGQSVSWTAYRLALLEQMKEARELILLEGGPVEEWVYEVPAGSIRG